MEEINEKAIKKIKKSVEKLEIIEFDDTKNNKKVKYPVFKEIDLAINSELSKYNIKIVKKKLFLFI
jgi:hypothetical protein